MAPAANAFGMRLRNAVPLADQVLISPLSTYLTLGLLLYGCEGPTRNLVAGALGTDVDGADRAVDDLRRLLAVTREVQIASGVFHHPDLTPAREVAERIRQYIGAEIRDWGPDGVKTVNDWVRQATATSVPRLIHSIAPDEVAILAHALVFEGRWNLPFRPS